MVSHIINVQDIQAITGLCCHCFTFILFRMIYTFCYELSAVKLLLLFQD